jgi:phosphatidylglycerol lysyltransferase
MSDQILALKQATELESTAFTFSERVGYLKKFGAHSQSFSTLQPGMQYFDVPGIGYVAYMRKWGGTFVLSDPVCAPESFGAILEHFHKRYPNASYVQVSKPVVEFMHLRFGLYGTQFGSESRIDLSKWSLSGKKKQILRTALNQAEKSGISVQERFSDDHTREISEAWIRTRKCKSNEIRFLIRPMEMDYRENERHFYAYQDGKAVGFIYFDPIYRNNEIISYVPNISRANADFRQGIFYTLMARAMESFKAEGVPYLDLGLIPLSLDSAIEHQESPLLKRLLHGLYNKGNFLYNFKGLEFTKSRFRGDNFKTYCCHKRSIPALEFLAMFKLTRLL